MNRWYKQLEKLAVDTRKANTAFFEVNRGDQRGNSELEKIWNRYDNGVAAIRGDIAANVRDGMLDKFALSAFDEVVHGLSMTSRRSNNDWIGGDWMNAPSGCELMGAEAIIAAAPAF